MSTSTPRLESRLRELSQTLCASLDGAIRSALAAAGEKAGANLRPVLLTSKLGLDKSLASRVVRAIGSDDPIRALHRTPTPQGLSLVARATSEAGADKALVKALEAASMAYGELLAEFSGGRTDLEATLADWIPEQRERAERDARRSVFRGMTTLSGTRTSAIYNSLYLVPPPARDAGSEPTAAPGAPGAPEAPSHAAPNASNYANSLVVSVRQDLRRLRSGARLHAMSLQAAPRPRESVNGEPDPMEGVPPQARFTLDGAALTDDPSALLLRDLCSHPLPELELQHTGERIVVSVHPEALDVNEFATIGLGWRTERHFPRHASGSHTHGCITMGATSPTEALVIDIFLHKDLGFVGTPFASTSVATGRVGPSVNPKLIPAVELDAAPVALDLDAHPSGLASPDVRACGAIAENACREAGYDLAEFSKYRFRIAFPTPTEQMTIWWELPGRPAQP